MCQKLQYKLAPGFEVTGSKPTRVCWYSRRFLPRAAYNTAGRTGNAVAVDGVLTKIADMLDSIVGGLLDALCVAVPNIVRTILYLISDIWGSPHSVSTHVGNTSVDRDKR